MNIVELSQKLEDARKNATAISPLTTNGFISVEDAYAIQYQGFERALSRGEQLAGYKMGLTSLAKQRDVKVFEPIKGYLLKSYRIDKNSSVSTRGRIHPRVEPEIAVTLKKRLHGANVTLEEVTAALDTVVPALEILDSRFQSFTFSLPDVVADNTSASGYILGEKNLLSKLADLNLMGIVLKQNGVVVETGAPAAVLGNPLLSVVGLVKLLAKENRALEPGQVVLTGGITASVSFKAGDAFEVSWPSETLSFTVI